MKVFLFGDYDYFVKMYGVSGAHGTHPCLNCKASKAQTEAARGDQQDNFPKRSVENRKKDHQLPPPPPPPLLFISFFFLPSWAEKQQQQKTKKAKHYNSVMFRPLWDIDLSQVVPRTLSAHTPGQCKKAPCTN